MRLGRAKSIRGEAVLPGDKSISHRAAMMASIAEGESQIKGFAESADCASTLKCLMQLGVGIERDGNDVRIRGKGKGGYLRSETPLDCGNSGTTMRLLAGLLAGHDLESVLIGDESLSRRPMRRIIDPLKQMGAAIESSGEMPPLTIIGRRELLPIDYEMPVASAQLKSCILFAGLYTSGTTTVFEPTPTRDHTERMLDFFGASISSNSTDRGRRISIDGASLLTSREIIVPSDISSAAFFVAAASCLPGSELRLSGVGLNPTRTAFVDVLSSMGAEIRISNQRIASNEPIGDITVVPFDPKEMRECILAGPVIGNLIDEIPILAIVGTQIEGGLEVRDAAELRIKESDRIASIVANLRKMGAKIDEFDDGFRVFRSELKGAVVDSFGDHRIAMAFAVAALIAEGETEILNSECVDVSFPGFFDTLRSITLT